MDLPRRAAPADHAGSVPRHTARRVAATVLLFAVLGGLLSTRPWSGHRPVKPVLIATGPSPPAPWTLLAAEGRHPLTMVEPDSLTQRFRAARGPGRIELTITGANQEFGDEALGSIKDPNGPAMFAPHRGDVSPQQYGARTYTFWSEGRTTVSLAAEGLDVTEVTRFVRALEPGARLTVDGFSLPGGGWTVLDAIRREPARFEQPSASLRFGDGRGAEVTVTVVADRPEQPTSTTSFFAQPAGGTPQEEEVELQSGVQATVQSFGGQELTMTWWDPSGRHRVELRAPCCGEIDRESVLRLARSIRFADDKLWAQMIAPLQADMLRQPVRSAVDIGPLQLTTRFHNTPGNPSSVVCTPTRCTEWDADQPGVTSADLIIDHHWWHIERAGLTEMDPTWRTSPSTKGTRRADHQQVVAHEVWRALDLGTHTKALRRNDDPSAYARPVG